MPASRQEHPVIRIDDLHFGYRRTRLYDGFHLHIDQPGVYGLFGRNGSGKSTLLKLLAGLLFPQRGTIAVAGREPRKRHPDHLAGVYLVPEEFHLPDVTPAELARTHSAFYPRFSAPAFADYLREFELAADQRFGEMSLGQKKKATIAFALATMTPLLLLDEPTNGLDILGRDQFKAIVARPEHAGRIIVISTHQAHDLEKIMSHVLFVDAARLALSAPLPELAAALEMGVVEDADALAATPGVIYSEAMGLRHAYVAARRGGDAGAVHLELLYKALSRNQPGVLAAVGRQRPEVVDV
jgi:ABC-2 type transport system ATP-binding protein